MGVELVRSEQGIPQGYKLPGDGVVVLGSQQLRGGHQCRLIAIFHRLDHGAQGHHGLAGAHIPLQEPVHGPAGAEVPGDLRKGPLLGARQSEGQRIKKRLGNGLGAGVAAAGTSMLPHKFQPHGKQKKLLKHQPPPGLCQDLGCVGRWTSR